jgi:glycosyltransferase involved in cell wall biosynthesis
VLDVLHVIPLLWSGAGRVLTHLCTMQARSLRVGIVTAGRSNGERDWPEYRRALSRAGVRHTRIDFFARDSQSFWNGSRTLAALIDRERPRVVHAHAGAPAAAAAVARTLVSRPVRIISHFYSWGMGRPTWMNDMDMWGLRQADRVVCSAEAYRRVLVAGGVAPRRIVMIPWGVETTGTRTRVDSRKPFPVLGFVGRVEPRKGQLQLVRAVAGLRSRWPAIRLDLVGPTADPSYEAAIREQITRTGLDGHVRLLGKVTRPASHVAGWDLFVSLSCDEGQGMAILEAMELATPVAAAAVAGVEDFVSRGDHAFVLPPEPTTKQVTDRLRAILVDRERLEETGRRGRAFVHRDYGWPRTFEEILALYRFESQSGQ